MIVEFISVLSSIISNRFVASSADICETPKSSRTRSLKREYFLSKFVYVPSAREIFISSSSAGILG